jgi:hypothetical protein
MRFLYVYLLCYFALIGGAAIALWRAGVLSRISPIWLGASALFVVGFGLLVAITSTKSTPARPK